MCFIPCSGSGWNEGNKRGGGRRCVRLFDAALRFSARQRSQPEVREGSGGAFCRSVGAGTRVSGGGACAGGAGAGDVFNFFTQLFVVFSAAALAIKGWGGGRGTRLSRLPYEGGRKRRGGGGGGEGAKCYWTSAVDQPNARFASITRRLYPTFCRSWYLRQG